LDYFKNKCEKQEVSSIVVRELAMRQQAVASIDRQISKID
jgi:hypothetical protein